jgi:dephospho-CoA kinase
LFGAETTQFATMMTVAITGGIACGKSLVAGWLAEMGVPVCEADSVAREVLSPGEAVFGAVCRAFGPGILDANGSIDRRRLGQVVFSDASRRQTLNNLMHPEIMSRIEQWRGNFGPGTSVAVGVIPLLYEAGAEVNWDRVICVASPEALQVSRLLARGLTLPEAHAWLAAQWPLCRKIERADYVLFNSSTTGMLKEQMRRVWCAIGGG